jgi:zinc/manganese transport system substrate-binding protein
VTDRITAAGIAMALLLLPATAGPLSAASESPPEQPTIVVTTSILGAVVRDLVGDGASVTVLMGNGVDPHDWSPSARDLEAIYAADLVVANGLDLEEGLHDTLEVARAEGVPIFEATDHITVRSVVGASDEDADHAHGAGDPHFWVDPLAMLAVVEALGPLLAEQGLDVTERQADLVARLTDLDTQVRQVLAAVPPDDRRLVTGHESMGYFADRYGFEMVGTVIPGLSTQGEVSARAMADLAAAIREVGVDVIFAEVGTPQAVTQAIASETGARVVELPTHLLPDDGSYFTFIIGIAETIAEALS